MGVWNMDPRKELPYYNLALGPAEATLVAPPPFNFPGVTARVFPLRASLNILNGFCQSYLNVAPEIWELRPYLPYVLLVVLDYGRMAIEEANTGWISQHEVFFSVPLGMWRRDRMGRRKFVKWVVNTPFIVVDSPSSLTTGRETYGWPKVLAKLKDSPERWLTDPRNPIRLLTLDLKGLSCSDPDVRLLEIDQRLNQNPTLAPPDPRLIEPFDMLSRLTRTTWAIGSDVVELLVGAPLAGFGQQSRADRREVFFDSLRRLSGFYREPGLDVVTLKQFRDAEDPTQICYQALVESRLSVTRYNRGGLLGLYNQLLGDITGGFRIHLHENPAVPIVESLGLEVTRERTHDGRAVSLLEPFFPFWMSVDLTYGRGETLCWRMRNEPWYRKTVQVGRRPPKTVRAPYNTFAGAAAQVWYGPFVIPEASFDVFPLRADRAKLTLFLSNYLNLNPKLPAAGRSPEPSGERRPPRAQVPELLFELAGSHVFLTASRHRMLSLARSASWIEACQITFYVPLFLHHGNEKRLVLATPFSFVDNPTLAMTLREVQGVPAMDASIEAPSRFWKTSGTLLRMDLDVYTALNAGLRCERRTVLRVDGGAPAPAPGPVIPPPPGGLAEPHGTPGLALGRLMLKQFRDAGQPDRACYQSLIFEPWTLTKSGPIVWLDEVKALRIYRYPSLPLVDMLGLQPVAMEPPARMDGAIAEVLQPDHPFRISLTVEIGLGEELSHSAGTLPWKLPRIPDVLPQVERFEKLARDQKLDLAVDGLLPLIRTSLDPGRAGGSR